MAIIPVGGSGGGGGGGDTDDGGDSGGDVASLSIEDLSTTRYRMAPTSGEHSHPTFRARVTNSGSTSAVATVRLWFGPHFVGEMSGSIGAGETETLSRTVEFGDLAMRGVVPGNDYPLHAFLQEGPAWDSQEIESGTMQILADPIPGKGPTGGDDSESEDDPESTPDGGDSASAGSGMSLDLLPPLGPLTATQTTLAVGVGGVLLLVVVL